MSYVSYSYEYTNSDIDDIDTIECDRSGDSNYSEDNETHMIDASSSFFSEEVSREVSCYDEVLEFVKAKSFITEMEHRILFPYNGYGCYNDDDSILNDMRSKLMQSWYGNAIHRENFHENILYIVTDQSVMFDMIMRLCNDIEKWFFYVCYQNMTITVELLIKHYRHLFIDNQMIQKTLNKITPIYRPGFEVMSILLEYLPANANYVLHNTHYATFDYETLCMFIESNKICKDHIDKYVSLTNDYPERKVVINDKFGPIYHLIHMITNNSIINKNKHYKKIKYLLNQPQCDPSYNNNLYMFCAIKTNNLVIAKILISHPRIDLEKYAYMMIDFCIRNDRLKMLVYLLSYIPQNFNKNEYIQLLVTATEHPRILNVLLNYDDNNDVYSNIYDPSMYSYVDDYVRNCLMEAVRKNRIESVTILLNSNRVDPTMCDNLAIRLASRYGNADIIRILLEYKNVNPVAHANYCIKTIRKYIACYTGADREKYVESLDVISKDTRVISYNMKKKRSIKFKRKKFKIKE